MCIVLDLSENYNLYPTEDGRRCIVFENIVLFLDCSRNWSSYNKL